MIKLIFAFITLLALTAPAFAEYYKYEDSNGNVVFTDNPSSIPRSKSAKMNTVRDSQETQKQISENIRPDTHSPEINNKKQEDFIREKFKTYLKDKHNIEAKESCPAETRVQITNVIKTIWRQQSQAMISGNLDQAFGFFSVFSRDEMRRKMSSMSKSEIKEIFGSYKSIEINTLVFRLVSSFQ
ncbi:MAG: hypothetical protein CXR30_17065 [Geobacter sp.]|nr:MAG: hypothetical protein CXR30_17065 [Geobacter sp.]